MGFAPAALDFIGCWNLGGVENVIEALFQNLEKILGFNIEHEGIKAGLAAHWGKVDERISVIAQVLSQHVL